MHSRTIGPAVPAGADLRASLSACRAQLATMSDYKTGEMRCHRVCWEPRARPVYRLLHPAAAARTARHGACRPLPWTN